MSNDYPPSSPTAESSRGTLAHRVTGNVNIGRKPLLSTGRPATRQVPTPQPSSSIGAPLSSPVKELYEIPTSPTRAAHPTVRSPIRRTQLNVELDLSNFTTLTVGRKGALCDVVLPGLPNISRKHAVITNLKEDGKFTIECTGTNGIIIELPNDQHISFMNKKIDEDNSFEVQLTDNQNQHGTAYTKKITEFSLDMGDKVTLPFVDGLKIDFRQADVTLSAKRAEHISENSSILSDVEELSSSSLSDSYLKHATPELSTRSQSNGSSDESDWNQSTVATRTTTDISQVILPNALPHPTITPHTQTAVMDPKTPQKMNPKLSGSRHYETPVPDRNAPNKRDKRMRNSHANEDAPVLNLSNPLETSSEQTYKRQKVQNSQPSDMTEDRANFGDALEQVPKKKSKSKRAQNAINSEAFNMVTVAELEAKGINCQEIQHILSNHLAFAAQQQTPLSQLKTISTSVSQLSEVDLRFLLENEKSIGVIKREGKDAAGKLLEEEFYYDIENDYDENRRGLVTSLKGGRAGIRSSRKSHKQYFWKRPGKK